MKADKVRKSYDAAWNRLFDLVMQRNRLLRQLSKMGQFASEFSPDTAMFVEFDFDKARDILAKVQEMTPTLHAAIDELNGYAEQLGKPVIRRQKSPL